MIKDIWVFIEQDNGELDETSCGLLSEAKMLVDVFGGKVGAVVTGEGVESYFDILGSYGANRIFFTKGSRFHPYDYDSYLRILVDLVIKYHPSMMLFVASSFGREMAARLASRLRVGLVANCAILRTRGSELELFRSVYMGRLYRRTIYQSREPYLATIDPSSIDTAVLCQSTKVEVIPVPVDVRMIPEEAPINILDMIKADPKKMDLSRARIIVAGGKGMGQHFHLIEELADVLGASIGGTRMAIDEGLLPFEQQIGQTGKTVSPKLYIACGISGAIHHMAGIKNVKHLVAINTDRNAPIFKAADVKVIGDVRDVIPLIIARLKSRQNSTKGWVGIG